MSDPSPTASRRRSWWLVAGLLALALVFAAIRWSQCARRLAGPEVVFSQLNAMTWDSATRVMTRTGGDPYAWLTLPAGAIPLRHITLEFAGPPPADPWPFFIYPYPYYLPGEAVTESRVVRGVVAPSKAGFTVDWDLGDSKIVRLDLPDSLSQPLTLERVVLRTRFAAADQWAFIGCVTAALIAALLLVWPSLSAAIRRWPRVEWLLMAAMMALDVALIRDIQLQFYGSAGHDDALFVNQAAALLDGQWLGRFDELTLSKGPTFSFFLAAVGWSGVPLKTAEAILHVLAGLALVVALRPLLPRPGLRLLLLAAVLFEPNSLSAATLGRVLRSGIQPALALLTLAGVIGLALAADRSWRRMAGWALLAGAAGTAFWYSREEGVWLLPSVALLLGAGAVTVVRSQAPGRWWRLALLALPFAIAGGGTWMLRTLNAHHYGAPVIVDVRDGYFSRAYGALVRITPREAIPGVPVTRETRLRAYAVSPSFAQLQPVMEGWISAGWNRFGWENISHPSAGKEIRGGWFQWALRQAAAATGHYQNAATADLYWRSVARELNRACDSGALEAGPWRKGFFPRWDASLWRPLGRSIQGGWSRAARVTDFYPQPNPSVGTPDQQALFARLTHETGMVEVPPPTLRTHVRVMLAHLFQWCGGVASLLAIACLGWLGVAAVRRREAARELSILASLLGGAFALVVIVALVDVTSFSALHAMYVAPATPLLVAAWLLAPAWAWWRKPNILSVSSAAASR